MTTLSDNLWRVAEDTARAFDFAFAPDCESHLRAFIDHGANDIEAQGLTLDSEKVSLARANVNIFVTAMVAEARREGLRRLHEPTFFAAKERLCPLWPFC